VQFKFLMRSSTETRFEQRGELAPAVIVCNGSNAWVYSPPLHRYRKEPSAGNKLCSLIAEDWKVLPISLESPVLAGLCGLEPSTPSLGYKLVRGFSEPERISSDRIRRTLCIDPKRKLIVWEKFESQYTRVYTYSTNDQNVELAYEAFVFEPPPDGEPTDQEHRWLGVFCICARDQVGAGHHKSCHPQRPPKGEEAHRNGTAPI
jgi:hypothetical protein